MSTGNKKAFKKIKKITEKDKRMAQLEKEIARLEQENGKLKRDSVEYKNRLAAFDGATRFDPDFSKLNPGSQAVAGNRFTRKSRENFEAASPSKNIAGTRKAMTTNGEIVSCPGKQVIKKCIREVPCPQGQSKRKQDVLCPTTQMVCRRRPEKETGCRRPPKCVKRPQKFIEICPAGNAHSTSANGCPKCEENRIQKLECEVFQLRREIEHMKHERKEADKALQKAILRGACALSGGYKTHVPGSIEKLLNPCDSNVSASSSYSVTLCSTKPASATCGRPKKRNEFACCLD